MNRLDVRTAGTRNPILIGLVFLAGIWVLISPWVLGFSDVNVAMWSDLIVGIVIAVLAAIRYFTGPETRWLSWINVILGIWLLISPWVLGFTDTSAALWDNVIFGIVVIVLAWASGVQTRMTTTQGA